MDKLADVDGFDMTGISVGIELGHIVLVTTAANKNNNKVVTTETIIVRLNGRKVRTLKALLDVALNELG